MKRPQVDLKLRRYRGVVALIALSFLTALFAAGVPGLVERQLTNSLRQSLASSGSVNQAATALGTSQDNTAPMADIMDSFVVGVPGGMRPLTGQSWDGLRLIERIGVQDEPFSASMNLEYRSPATSHLRLVSGSLPDSVSQVDGRVVFDVALTSAGAKFYSAHVGTLISGDGYAFRVSAIVEPTDPSSAFWNTDPDLAVPASFERSDGSVGWTTSALVGVGEIAALASVNKPDGSPDPVVSVYCVPLDTAGYTARDAGTLLSQMTAFSSGTVATEDHLQISVGPADTISTFQSGRNAVDGMLGVIMTGVAAVGCATVLLCARLVVGRRRAHYALLRARGQSLRQLALQVLGDLGPSTAVALAAAGVLAATLADGTNAQSATLFAGVAVVVLCGPPLLAVLDHRGTARLRADSADAVRRRPKARRRVFELVVVLLAVGAMAVLRQRGLGGATGGTNTLGTLAPILLAAVTTGIAVRCYPLLLAPAAKAAQRRDGATAFLGLTGAVRSSLSLALPTFGIVLALTLAALGGLAYQNVQTGRAEESWLQTGTDISIALSTGTDPKQAAKAVAALEQVPGVTGVTDVAEQSLSSSTMEAAVYAVDPSSYTAVAADSPWPFAGALPEQRGSGPVPVVVSADSPYTLGQVFKLNPGAAPSFTARVVGIEAQSPVRPAYGPAEPFVLVPDWASTAAYPDLWLVSEILVSGNGIDAAKVNAALAHTVPGANRVQYRTDALDRLMHQPLEPLAEFGYVLGLVAAGCFGICGILLALALTAAARSRRLMLLGTLGLSPRQARGIALAEIGPLAASTALGGLLAALALPAVFGSALNLTEFTGLPTEAALRLDPATPLLTVAAALGLTFCGVLLQAAIARRRAVPAQLRMGEDT